MLSRYFTKNLKKFLFSYWQAIKNMVIYLCTRFVNIFMIDLSNIKIQVLVLMNNIYKY